MRITLIALILFSGTVGAASFCRDLKRGHEMTAIYGCPRDYVLVEDEEPNYENRRGGFSVTDFSGMVKEADALRAKLAEKERLHQLLKAQAQRRAYEQAQHEARLVQQQSSRSKESYASEFLAEPAKSQWLHDPFSGNSMPRTGAGYTDPRTGTFYHNVGSGVVNTRTGQFTPTH